MNTDKNPENGKSKLVELLKIIKGKFKRDLRDFIFVSSNQLPPREREIVVELLNQKGLSKITDDSEIVKSCLQEHEKANWNRIKSRIVNVIKRYLRMSLAEEKEPMSNMVLLNYFFENGMKKNLSNSLKMEKKALAKSYPIDQYSSLYRFRLNELAVTIGKNERKEDENLGLMIRSLDEFYIENRLRCLCEELNRNYIINTGYDSNQFLAYAENYIANFNSPGILIYYNIYKMLADKDKDQYFLIVNQLIQANADLFSVNYLKEVYVRLMNFCIRKINQGAVQYAPKYLEYIDFLIAKGLFLESGKLSTMRYKNCIAMSLVAKDIAWAERFLESHLDHLDYSTKESAYRFNKAQILFFKKAYQACEESLLHFHSFDMYYKISYDKLMLKLYYYQVEEGRFDVTYYIKKIESLRKFISIQRKLSEEKKSNVTIFTHAVSKIVKGKKIDVERLLGKISITDFLWLREIINKEK